MVIRRFLIIIVALLFFVSPFQASAQVKIKKKQLILPTYETGPADPNPIFFNGRRYQGASGKIYPYPLLDNLTDKKIKKAYDAIILENEYVEVCVIPEMGGKFYYAKDKTNDYYFIYYNTVVKPALIGMTGAWTSGGVEWNIPHHHRASTFSPTDFTTTEHDDGSKTVWVGETELRHRMKWVVGLTLHPGKALVEATVKVINATPEKNSILVWANAATHTNENYQVFFPPLTQYATFHKKNQFTEWPVSNQVYTGADFRGVDISRWENHSTSTSFFAWEPQGNFVAGYDHEKDAGTILFGNPHINPGMKLWSWGNNKNGRLWNKFLTDESGHYVELMFGAFSDNQPDYSWIHPYETKTTRMYFMPYRELGSVKKVNKNGAIDLEVDAESIKIGAYANADLNNAEIKLTNGNEIIYQTTQNIGPGKVFRQQIKNEQDYQAENLTLEIIHQGRLLFDYSPAPKPDKPMPPTVKAPETPDQLSTADSLYFAGLRLEQFHEPQLNPLDYYLAAIEKNPDYVKANIQAGINYYRQEKYELAEKFLEKVVQRVTFDYTTAEDMESLYYLGLVKLKQDQQQEAYDLLYKASWDYEWFSPAHYQLALIELNRGNREEALNHLNESLTTNQLNLDALSAKASLLRRMGQTEAAQAVVDKIKSIYPVSLRASIESLLLAEKPLAVTEFDEIAASGMQAFLEEAAKYGLSGFYNEAIRLLNFYTSDFAEADNDNPLPYYLLSYYYHLDGQSKLAEGCLQKATAMSLDYAFPFREEMLKALQFAFDKTNNPKVMALIGNYYYDLQPRKAIESWEKAASKADNGASGQVYRNLAFAYANQKQDYEKAVAMIEKAIKADPNDPRYFFEQDEYLAFTGESIENRLAHLAKNESLALSTNNTLSAYAILLVLDGKYDKAIEVMSNHHLRKWEGDGANPYDYWLYAHMMEAKEAINDNNYQQAADHLNAALSEPDNIDVPVSNREYMVYYFKGQLAKKQGDKKSAKSLFEKASQGEKYGGEMKFFAARAYQELGEKEKAQNLMEELLQEGEKLLKDKPELDFFNPFAKATSEEKLNARAHYLMALGNLGLDNKTKATENYRKAKELDPGLMGFAFKAFE